MTQSFTLREPGSELTPEARFTRPTMMPPWKQQSDVAFNLELNLEKPGQKRRRSFMPTTTGQQQQQDQFQMYSNENNNMMPNERGSNDSVQLTNSEPYHMFGDLGSSAFPSERRGFYSRMIGSSSCEISPFPRPELVEHTANPLATVFSSRHNANVAGARHHHQEEQPSPASAAAATAQAIANFQTFIDQGRASAAPATAPTAGRFQAYHHGSNGSRLRNAQRQAPSLANHEFSSLSSFGLRTNSSSELSYCQAMQQNLQLASGETVATGVHGSATVTYEVNGGHEAFGANVETPWPSLACNTSARSVSETTLFFPDLESPCTPRGNRSVDTVFLSEAQEEYLQHSERLNSEALLSADSPPHRGRRLSYNSSPSRENNDYNIFHPLELHHQPSDLHHRAGSEEQHLHVYFDEFGISEHTEVEEAAAPTTITQVDESVAVSGVSTAQEESFSLNFNPTPAAAIASAGAGAGEKEITRKNVATADAFDLNEVPVSVSEATPPKPRKKYHPRVAKDKRMCKRRVDGTKVPLNPGDGGAKPNSFAKNSAKKRAGQQTTTSQCDTGHEEGRDSSYPEVVDMEIEVMMTTPVATTQQHDTAACDCEACIKLRLERRNSSAAAAGLNSRFTSTFNLPQSPAHSSDSLSNSPSARRTLFQAPPAPELDQASNEAPAERLAVAAHAMATRLPDSIPEEGQGLGFRLSQANSSAYENVKSFLKSARASCLQQFDESVTQLGWDESQAQESAAADSVAAWNRPFGTMSSNFMSRLCPRGILSPHDTPFRDMNHMQRVVYLKSILNSNPQLKISPESLLRHVHDHLPEDEKEEFESNLWPLLLTPLSEEQTMQLTDCAFSEQQQQQPQTQTQTQKQVQEAVARETEVAVVKRKPGPKVKKKGLAMTLWPNLVESKAIANKAGKGRKSKKKNASAVEEDDPQNCGLEMVPYENNSSDKSPYENDGNDKSVVVYEKSSKTVVVYEGPFLPLRKKKARAKVVLDGETVRVWKLLMGKPASAGAENVTDAENERKWEDERRKMKAQALRFIERMHIVQGDRSFSCWKGSVVDSVVGAFLTQNVNDVLSSSAFMSMRSRFPSGGLPQAPLQTKNPKDAVDFDDSNNDSPSSMAPQFAKSSTQNTAAPEFSRTSVTVLELQESRNQESNYETAATSHKSWQNHEQSAASTTSEVINLPEHTSLDLLASTMPALINPANKSLPQAEPQEARPQALSQEAGSQALPQEATLQALQQDLPQETRLQTFPQALPQEIGPQALPQETGPQVGLQEVGPQAPPQGDQSKSQSESSSGLEYQMVPTEGSTNHVDMAVVTSENAMAREFSTEGRALVEGYREPSHGKYNPKTGLTGLERAKIEEKQVTARKSFDFSTLNAQFKPRMAGENRPPAALRPAMTEDGVDWEAVRAADVQAVADVIKERGLNWILAGRIKAFLERLHLDYGALDLEWLRSMSTDQTKEFLLSIRGLGLKSVECIRLLTLHHLAFPVDTNVGRICVRLGWVPLEPLPEELQLHLLELYPVQATIQKYLWPRLCKLDQQTLYELHYQMITFGKVFCTKSKPNCNACPMRPECKHFASALSSAKLALPASDRSTVGPTLALPPGTEQDAPQDRGSEPPRLVSQYCCQPIVEEPMTPESEADLEVFDIEDYPFTVEEVEDDTDMRICFQNPQAPNQLVQQSESINKPNCCSILRITDTYTTILEPEPVPETLSGTLPAPLSGPMSVLLSEPLPEPVSEQIQTIFEDLGGLATSECRSVQLSVNCEETESSNTSVIEIVESVLDLESDVNTSNSNSNHTNNNSTEVLIQTTELHEMVLVPPGVASLPVPKLKNVGRLRTVHYVYELPDNHPLLDGLNPKEHDDPCTYLLAIWSPGEVPQSMPNMNVTMDEENPFATSNCEGEESIKATLLVPCRTAMRGSFPLNGTYFQVNEVFADHASSLQPILVSRTLLWNLRRRFVYFGTSVTSIFRGMTVEEIQACFWRGYVCVRGFDRATKAPKPLVGRLHLHAGKVSGREQTQNPD